MIGGGFIIGKQWQLGNSRFIVDLFGGLDINGPNFRPYDDNYGLELLSNLASGFGVRFGSTFGYRLNK
jgi:hypothetical protein